MFRQPMQISIVVASLCVSGCPTVTVPTVPDALVNSKTNLDNDYKHRVNISDGISTGDRVGSIYYLLPQDGKSCANGVVIEDRGDFFKEDCKLKTQRPARVLFNSKLKGAQAFTSDIVAVAVGANFSGSSNQALDLSLNLLEESSFQNRSLQCIDVDKFNKTESIPANICERGVLFATNANLILASKKLFVLAESKSNFLGGVFNIDGEVFYENALEEITPMIYVDGIRLTDANINKLKLDRGCEIADTAGTRSPNRPIGEIKFPYVSGKSLVLPLSDLGQSGCSKVYFYAWPLGGDGEVYKFNQEARFFLRSSAKTVSISPPGPNGYVAAVLGNGQLGKAPELVVENAEGELSKISFVVQLRGNRFDSGLLPQFEVPSPIVRIPEGGLAEIDRREKKLRAELDEAKRALEENRNDRQAQIQQTQQQIQQQIQVQRQKQQQLQLQRSD